MARKRGEEQLQEDRLEWCLDVDCGTATLPLDPLLRCFGTAAPRDRYIATSTASQYGNMDYRGFRTGVTACLPVFLDGALFHLGNSVTAMLYRETGRSWEPGSRFPAHWLRSPKEVLG